MRWVVGEGMGGHAQHERRGSAWGSMGGHGAAWEAAPALLRCCFVAAWLLLGTVKPWHTTPLAPSLSTFSLPPFVALCSEVRNEFMSQWDGIRPGRERVMVLVRASRPAGRGGAAHLVRSQCSLGHDQ